MVSLFQAIILSIVHGITEWFPVSSTGHLALLQHFFGFQDFSFDIFLHLASVLALIIFFRKDILAFFSFDKKNRNYMLKIILAILPAGILGILYRDFFESLMGNLFLLGICFIISGIVIYLTKFTTAQKKEVSFFDALIIGMFQAIALLPSVSRSGMTISSGLFRNINRVETARFSFLLAIPVLLGASLFEAKNIAHLNISYSVLLVSFVVTLATSLLTIKFIMTIFTNDKFYLFSWYNIILGLLIVGYSLFF